MNTLTTCQKDGTAPAPCAGLQPLSATVDEASLYRIVVEQAQVGLFVTQGPKLLFANPKLSEMFGYAPGELGSDMLAINFTVPAQRDAVLEQIRQRPLRKPTQAFDVQFLRKDGSTFDGRVWGWRTELRGVRTDIVTVHDISEITRSARAAERRAQQLAQAEELARMGSTETDLLTGETRLSAGMYHLLGIPADDLPAAPGWLYDRVPAAEREIVRSIQEGLATVEPFEFQHRIVAADGSVHTVLHRGMVETDTLGRPVRTRAILQDITAQRDAEQAIDDLAHLDPATRLPNRTALLAGFEEAAGEARRSERVIGLLVMQIDQFRVANQTLGYAGGDRLLKAVAQRLGQADVPMETLAHLGSGEFAAVLTQLAAPVEAAAQRQAYALIAALAEPFEIDGAEIFVTSSVGVALYPTNAQDAAELLDQAQGAMRQAHAWGSNHVFFHSAEESERATARLAAESALRHALSRNELYLCYQPQVDLRSGRVVGVEALARWNTPSRGEVSPAEFIPLAEQTGLIVPIGEWVLRTACEDSMRWQAAGLPALRVSVNLSVHQIEQPNIVERIQAILLETRMNPHHLGIEVTESVLASNVDSVVRKLTELKAIGVEIALDDFGTGYSNLAYLSKMPIDVLKIDRSFVHDVTAAPEAVSITRAIINMAHALQLTVVAEGVENDSQLALLVANQCDLIQGYYFSRPVRAEAIAAMLGEGRRLPEHQCSQRVRRRTLLLVDDEENIISSLRRLLRRDGYHIVTANSGPQGLQRLAENDVDVIVSDQRMPGMTGTEFLRRAKEMYPDTVRISLSGYTELQSITDAINEGAIYKFLTKPWDDERLRTHISEAFRHKEMDDENRRLSDQVQSANSELAEVNDRLSRLLESQRRQIDLDEARLTSSREVLENIPVALIGFDTDGMVASVNPETCHLLGDDAVALGDHAEQALPAALLPVWQQGLGVRTDVAIAGRRYQAICRDIGERTRSRGRLMVLTPLDP